MGKMMLFGVGGIVAIIAALKIVGALFGTILAIAAFFIFKILPIILIGWVVMKAWRHFVVRPAD
jgi:uncharacterized membrane protein